MSYKTGSLVISLDFELLWGVFDKVSLENKREYFMNTRRVIPEILTRFEKNKIEATWATVGMLFNNNWDEWNSNIPDEIPNYSNKNLCAYSFGNRIQDRRNEELCFAPALIKRIIFTKGQELATHTYSHYYCLEKGQNSSQFEKDIEKAIEISNNSTKELKSLVFPRNQINSKYLEICTKHGLKNIRSNPHSWYWRNTQKDSLIQKIFRTGDAYIGLTNKSYEKGTISNSVKGYNLQKASRLLRPHSSNKILNKIKMKRILNELEYAAKNGEVYHLWWHPHNFGNDPLKNLEDLEIIVKYFKCLQNKYGIQSKCMNSIV